MSDVMVGMSPFYTIYRKLVTCRQFGGRDIAVDCGEVAPSAANLLKISSIRKIIQTLLSQKKC